MFKPRTFKMTAHGSTYTLVIRPNPANRYDLYEPGSDMVEWMLYSGPSAAGTPIMRATALSMTSAKKIVRKFISTGI